jgi:ABC-type Co2+ transport system permease subunit
MHNLSNLDLQEVLKRVLKYLIEGLIVALAAFFIPKKGKLSANEVLCLSVTAAATFAILDMYAPSIGGAARAGAGLGIGANLVGFPGK